MKDKTMLMIAPFIGGILFAIGLALSGMTQPAKVIGFLNFFGGWDPSLAFVMVGAIGVNVLLLRVRFKSLARPFFASRFNLPEKTRIDARLVIGAIVFGMGWGLAGLCPGPALANLSGLGMYSVAATVAMVLGMYTTHIVDRFIEKAKSNRST